MTKLMTMLLKKAVLASMMVASSHAWLNDCGDMVTLSGRDFVEANVDAGSETDFTFETGGTTYATLAECRDAALNDSRFSSSQYIIGFTCTDNTVDFDLKLLYAASEEPVFSTSSADASATSYMCNQVCTAADPCANNGECSTDLKYCNCNYPNHDPTCSSTKDCSC